MDNILIISKAEENTYSTEEVIEAFNSANSLDEMKKYIENAQERLYTSWATVDALDKDGQKVPISEAIKQQEILMERGAPIRAGHQEKDVGRTLAYRILEHPITKTLGILHLNKIYNHNILDDKVWNDTVKKGKGGSSVGGFSTNKEMVYSDNGIFEELKGFNWLETTLTDKPRNAYSTSHSFSQVAKSEEEKMEETKKEETAMQENSEVSIDQRVANLEEAIGQIGSRMEELLKATAGKPDEAEVEADTAKEYDDKEETAKEEDKEEKEEPKEEVGKSFDVAKAFSELKTHMSEIKEELAKKTVVEVAKSDRPNTNIDKVEKSEKNYSFNDVMQGKISLEKFVKGE